MALGELPNGRHCDACRASNMESEAKSRQYPNVSFWTEDGGLRCAIRHDRLMLGIGEEGGPRRSEIFARESQGFKGWGATPAPSDAATDKKLLGMRP
jgi:hypothetical protein